MWRPASLLFLAGAIACGGEERFVPAERTPPAEPEKPGVEPIPSTRAMAILALVNDTAVGVEELDHGAKLDARAARNLITHRNGPDGRPDTEDDRPFRRLVDVDAVPYVGVVALMQLFEYATAHGYAATYQSPPLGEMPVRDDLTYDETALRMVLREERIDDADAVLTRALVRYDDGDRHLVHDELAPAGASCRQDIYAVEGYRWADPVVDRILEAFELQDRLALLAEGTRHDEDENGYLSQVELERAMIVLTRSSPDAGTDHAED